MTIIIKINPKKIDESKIILAANILRSGGLVAFPTETVYGLGANALDVRAVKKIFKTKGRPIKNPLIVHIANKKDIYKLTDKVSKDAKKLMNNFWPGPLTIILKKSKIVPKIVTAGSKFVAIRMPNNNIALRLIKRAKTPIAAPSANLSGRPSPTLAKHVINDLYGKIEVIIDGGKTKIGIESTVIDLTSEIPTILRPGKITMEDLNKVLLEVRNNSTKDDKTHNNNLPKSPGMKYKHYSPKAKVILVTGERKKVEEKIKELVILYKNEGKRVGVMTNKKNNDYQADITKFSGKGFCDIAKGLFKNFRDFDEEKIDIIITEKIKEKGFGLSIMDRIKRSANKIIKV